MGNTLAAIAEGSMAPLFPPGVRSLFTGAHREANRLRKDVISGPLRVGRSKM